MKMEALPPNHRDSSLCARIAGPRASHASACSHNPGPESALELLPSSALPSAQAFKAYPKIAALEIRTFHLLFKPDILTCYEQEIRRGSNANSPRLNARGLQGVMPPFRIGG